MNTQMPAEFYRIRDAVVAARQRTGDRRIGTNVSQGTFCAVRVVYTKRSSIVTDLCPRGSVDDIIAFLNGLGA